MSSSYRRGVDEDGVVHYVNRLTKLTVSWCNLDAIGVKYTCPPRRRANVTCLLCLMLRQDRP